MKRGREAVGALCSRPADFIVRFYLTGETCVQGKIEHVSTGQIRRFGSFLEMTVLIQSKLDEMDFPQEALESRTWEEEP
jgi:hypothetical protein